MQKNKIVALLMAAAVSITSIHPAFAYTTSTPQVGVGHRHIEDNGTIVRQPTCSEFGERQYHCTECGELMAVTKIPKLDHIPEKEGVIAKKPTEFDVGQKNFYCKVCGEIAYAEALMPLPPGTGEIIQPDPTAAPTPTPSQKPQTENHTETQQAQPPLSSGTEESDIPTEDTEHPTPVNAQPPVVRPIYHSSALRPVIDGEATGFHHNLPDEQQDAAEQQKTETFDDKYVSVTVPIFFANARFHVDGTFFTGKLCVESGVSHTPIEIQNVSLDTDNRWKIVAHDGEDELRGKNVSANINHCLTLENSFAFNPEFFTVAIPANSYMELPYKVCAWGPTWTEEKQAPLKIIMTIQMSH